MFRESVSSIKAQFIDLTVSELVAILTPNGSLKIPKKFRNSYSCTNA